MPKEKSHNDGSDSNVFSKPYSKSAGVHQKRKRQNVGDSPINTSTNTPTNAPNMLKYYMKHHSASMESFQRQSSQISEKIQKTNMAIAERTQENVQLKKLLHDMELQVQDLKNNCGELCKENDKINQKCTDVNEKYLSLETGYDKEFTHLNVALNKQKSELTAQQKHIMNLQEELKALKQEKHQLMSQLETVAHEKDNQIDELKRTNTQLLANISGLETAFDKKLEQIQEYETIQVQLKAEAQQHAAMLTEQLENSARCEAELRSTVEKLADVQKNCFELEELNKQLSNEMSNVTRRLEIETEQQQLKIDELYGQNQNLQSVERQLQIEIEALKEANEHIMAAKAEADAVAKSELSKQEIQLIELKKQIEAQQELLNASKALTDENAKMAQELQAHKQLYQSKLAELQSVLNQKNADLIDAQQHFAEQDRKKNDTIAELTYKIKQVSHVFGQPVGVGSVMCSPQVKEQTSKIPAATAQADATESAVEIAEISAAVSGETASSSMASRRRTATKRPIVQPYASDFNTDSDNDFTPNWQPQYSKLITKPRNGNVKRIRRVPRETDDAFDKIKNSDNP